jgi:hypothetical protein
MLSSRNGKILITLRPTLFSNTFSLRGIRLQGGGRGCIAWNLMICTPHQILFGLIEQKNEIGQICRVYGSI